MDEFVFDVLVDLDDLIFVTNRVVILQPLGVQLLFKDRQHIRLCIVVIVSFAEFARDCVSVVFRVAVWHAIYVAVGVGHALFDAVDLDDTLVITDGVVILQPIGVELQ